MQIDPRPARLAALTLLCGGVYSRISAAAVTDCQAATIPGPSPQRRPREHDSFTLIGLLVVIAITAILEAMFLPALAKTKDRARRVGCLNNHKHVGLFLQFYTDDNNDTFCGHKFQQVRVLPCQDEWWGNYLGP